MKTLTKFPHFSMSKNFLQQSFPQQSISTELLRLFEKLFSQKVEKGKYQGDKFSFFCQEILKLMEIE